jgi:hypothetical protein
MTVLIDKSIVKVNQNELPITSLRKYLKYSFNKVSTNIPAKVITAQMKTILNYAVRE